MKKVLLAMDEGIASKLAPMFEENSQSLKVIPQCVPYCRSIIQSLSRFKPDILFLSMKRIKYDTKDSQQELFNTIYKIKTDPEFSQVRIAVQASLPKNDPFLRELAKLQVEDIFIPDGNGGSINMLNVIKQLSKPANLKNIDRFLAIKAPNLHKNEILGKEDHIQNDNEIKVESPKNKTKPIEEKNEERSPKNKRRIKLERTAKTNQSKPVKIISKTKPSPQKKVSIPRPIKSEHTSKVEVEKNSVPEKKIKKVQKPHISHSKKNLTQKHIIVICILLAVCFVSAYIFHLSRSAINTPPYPSLINHGKYVQAATYYPSKAVEVENKMLNDSNVKDKATNTSEIADISDADPIKFDDAYFNGNFNKVVTIYEDSNNQYLLKLSNARRTMLAYSYMKTGDVQDAKEVAKPLNNQQLNDKINAYEKFQKANSILQDKLKSGQLNDSDRQKAQHEIRKNKLAMKQL